MEFEAGTPLNSRTILQAPTNFGVGTVSQSVLPRGGSLKNNDRR